MEGCPRSLMLNVDQKETFPTEFTAALKTYIREHYNEDADSYKNECSQLEQLRSASLRPSRDHSGCSTLRRYYAQLQFLQSRFPMEDGGAVNVQFTWTDLYSEEPIALCDVKFEQAAILHNLAALHSQLGCNEDRTAEEGMKVACTHFQAAAGIFQYLKAGSFCKVEHFIDHFANDAVFDMASALLQMYTNVMLGQAQECLLEKSILDSRKDSLIARISMQVHDYYNQALQFMDSQGPSYMGSRKAKLWTKSLKIKCCQFLAVAYIYMSNNADENQKFGEKVAYLKAASQKITEAQKASKGQSERTLELLQFLIDVVSNKLQGAVKDNDFIYHEVVPELDTLPEIKAAPLVKPIPFQPCDPSVSGPDIFQRLIPMGAHTDSSLYSEEKAKLLRRYVASIELKNQLLSKALSDLHIDDLLEPEGYDVLPDAIRQKSNSLKTDGNLKEAEDDFEELTKIGSKVEERLETLAKILEEDKRREKELEALLGPITSLPKKEDLVKELEQCQESHKKAMQTNTELLKVFKEHKHNLDLLVGPSEGLLAALPSLNIIDTPIDDGAVQRLRDLISKVELMKTQRKQFEADLRKQLAEDDITQLLVTREEGNKTLFFEEQLKKHSAACDLIQKNVDAQDKILKALTEANAKYAPTRQAVKEAAQRRDDAVRAFALSHDTFFELKEKLSAGLRFYQGLEKTVLKLEEKLKDLAEKRKKELDRIDEKEKEKKAKEKAKTVPARPGAEKPQHLVNPSPSSLGSPVVGQYPGVPGVPHPSMRPVAPNPRPQGIPFQPRMPGGAFPPGSFPGSMPPRPADPRVFPGGSLGVPARPPPPPGDARMRAPHPGLPPQTPPDSRTQQMFSDQSVPKASASPVPGPPVQPSMQPRPTVPFSQVGPRGPVPTEHLIHSTPRMSYPVPVGPSLPPGAPQGVQPAIPPGSPYQASQQPRPQLLPKQDPGPVSAQGLPSYDLAKLLPGSQPMIRPQQPPLPSQQGWPRGQNPSASQQQSGGPQLHPGQLNHLPSVTPQQQFQGPRGPHPPSQPQLTSQGGAPQMYQQHVPSGQMSQPLQPSPSQHQPKNWPTQPFQFPKLAQQSMQPLQPQQQFQQPNPQQPFQQLPPGQPPFPPPLQPQTVRPPQSQIPQQFQPQQPSQHPPLFQQQQPPQQQLQHPPLPPHQFQQPMQQFKQPGRVQSQFPQLQQPVLPPREPLQPTQFQTTLQSKGQQQQFQQLIQPPPNYPQQVPLQPQKPQQQSQFQPPLPLQPHSMQQSPQGQQFPSERLPQQIPHPGQPISQNIQTSLGSLKTQQGGKTPEMPPKGAPQMGQMSQRPSWQQESTTAPPKPPAGYPAQQSYSGYNQGQQLTQTSNVSTQLGYPVLPEKKRSQTDQLTPRPSQEGYPSQHPKVQRPGGLQPPQQQNTPAGSTSNWPYTQASQSLPSSGVPQQVSRQDSQEKPQGFGGKQGEGPPQVSLYRQTSVDQGWGSPLGDQNPPQGERPQNPRTYPPTLARQNLSEYDKQSQYQGQSRSRLASYPPYSGGVSEPPSAPPGGGQSYSCTPGSARTAPPLVQGVRPSPTSLPPSSAYATSYSVSVAQAQLSQQQQMQQLQTQMLLQQQQLIIQQQELLRHQQQQQQHESDQGHITQLFQQVLQQQTKLAEMEQKLAEHERHEEELKNEHTKTEGEKTSPIEEDKDAADKELHSPGKGPEIGGNDLHTAGKDPHSSELDPHVIPPHSSSNFGASWGKGFCDHSHGKLDMSQVFSDLAKKQINEISETSKHTDGTPHSSKPLVHGGDESSMLKIDCDTTEHSEKEVVVDELSETKGASEMDVIDSEVNKEPAQLTDKNSKRVKETESSLELKENDKGKSEASATSTELKQDGEHGVTAGPSDEDKEKRRRQEIEEQIQKIKELQKHTQPAPPPLPQKQRYLYEPGKMPEPDQLPLKPPDKATAEDQNKPSLHRQCGHFYNTQLSRIGQDENNECLSDEEYIQRLCRTVETFDALVVSLGQKRENSPFNGFISEWKVLDKMQKTDSTKFSTQAATLNPSKNRYRDVLPWDHTRVKLTTKEGGDYINANVIKKVTPLSPDYIMTQGPIAATLGDFWLMVWEQKAPVVVMLTKEVEGNRLKCHQYWPIDEGHTVVYGLIRVHMRSVNHGQAWVKRIMHVQHAESDEVLVVSHLQFVGWPDHGVPHSPSDLLTFLSEVHNHHQEKDPQTQRPLVVHCSAGVGRAGTFCIIYTAIRELHGTRNIVNIPKLVRIFRKHRKFTVQKKEQYEFCYRAILFYANQFVQLEKAAIAFKKSQVAPGDQSGEMSSMSSVTSLDSSGQRKPDEVSFLGEISDKDSSESGDEFDNEQSDVRDINSQGYAESGLASTVMSESELNRTVLENAEVKVPSEITNRPGTSNTKGCPDKCEEGIASVEDEKLKSDTCTSSIAGTLECPETSTFDADLSTTNKNPEEVEEDVSSAQTSKVQSASVTKNEASSASAGLSATNVETAQNREVKDSSVCSDSSKSSTDVEIAEVEANDSTQKQGDCNSEKGGCGDDKGCVSGEVVPVDSTQKQGDCNSEKGGCGDDKGCVSGEVVPVEGNATGRNVSTPESKEVDVSKEKSKTEPSSEKDVDVKNGDVEIKGNEVIHRRNSDVQMNEKTDKSESVSKEKSNPVGELKKEGVPKENQKQENDMDHSTPEKGILNHQEDEEPDKEEQHENVDTEQNETAEEKQPDSEKTASGDDKEKDKESDSYEKMKFGIQSQETGES